MTLDKFQKAWKEDAKQVRVSFDEDLIAQKVLQSHAAFRSLIYWRDVREVGIALLMIPVWLAMGITQSLQWTWYLTIPVLLWIAGFMLVDRWRHRQSPSAAGQPLSFYVKESLEQVEHQIGLLRNVFWWYLLPPSVSIMAFFVQTSWETTKSWWGTCIMIGLCGTFLFYLYRAIYRLNQTAVREMLEPRRDKLLQLIGSLEGASGPEDLDEILVVPDWENLGDVADLQTKWTAWAENWNRIIPSWNQVAIIIIPTVLGGYCGWRFPIGGKDSLHVGEVFFQSVVAAVIPFEIAFFSLWYRSYKRHQGQPLPTEGSTRPRAPALLTIAMILIMSILAFAAFLAHGVAQQSRRVPQQEPFTTPTKVSR